MIEVVVGAALSAVVVALAFHNSTKIRTSGDRRADHIPFLIAGGTAGTMLIVNVVCLIVAPGAVTVRTTVSVTMFILVTAVLLQSAAARRQMARPIREQPNGLTVLAVGAHPDDLELACGGTLAKLVDSGYEVHAIVMSAGAIGGDSSLRPSEAANAGSLLGLTSTTVHQLPDTMLWTHEMQMITAIEEKVHELAPTLILTHSENDHHQDHYAVHLATLRAARRHSSIMCFESPSSTRSFNPSVYVDIDDYLDLKIQAVQMHHDQSEKPYMTPERLRGIASFRGSQAKRTFAEGFEPVRLLATHPGVPL